MSIHTEDRDIVMEFTRKPAARILVNTGGSQGGTGASTGLMPSFTLGCGTWGGSSVSENVGPMHLINIKKVAYGLKDCETLASSDPNFNSINSKIERNSQEQFIKAIKENINCNDNEELIKLINQIVLTMKGEQ